MTASTAVHRALDWLDEERDAVADRGAAFEAFDQRVRAIPAEQAGPTQSQQAVAVAPVATATATGSRTQGTTSSTAAERCVTVRDAFADTVRPRSIADCEDDEPLVETIATELTEDVAVALVAETGWTPALKSAVLEAVATRRREVDALQETLQRERTTLEGAIDEIDGIVDWLQATADESFLQCGFEALRTKHERLEAFRDRLEELIDRRQAQFTDSTNRYGRGGTRHRSIVESVYSDRPTQYPLLSTATRLYGICGGCQRSVRSQLIRRV